MPITLAEPKPDSIALESNRAPFAQQLGAVHAECKLTKGKKQ